MIPSRRARSLARRRWLLLALAIAAALVATWLGLAGTPNALDRRVEAVVFERLPSVPFAAITALSDLGAPLAAMILTALASTLLLVRRRRVEAGLLFAATSAAAVLFPLLKRLFALPRPAAPLVEVGGYGLPSGHTLVSTVLWGCLAWLVVSRLRPTRARAAAALSCVALVVAVGASRIALAAHWLTDVVAGWLYGLALLALAVWLDPRSRAR